jgi:hypothetical protein
MRPMQEAMLAAITHRPGRPSRSEVLAELKTLDSDARSATPSKPSSAPSGVNP